MDVLPRLLPRLPARSLAGLRAPLALSAGLIVAGFVVAACARSSRPEPPTVARVDLTRYAGRWYEIARFDERFERGCSDVSAHYTLRDDGRVRVVNTCLKKGKLDSATGRARVINPPANSRLKVSFFWPFEGDYWVLALDEDYRWALVGAPDYESLWILSRERQLDEPTRQALLDTALARGYDTSKLLWTAHTGVPPYAPVAP